MSLILSNSTVDVSVDGRALPSTPAQLTYNSISPDIRTMESVLISDNIDE
jgi:hypothetical protein